MSIRFDMIHERDRRTDGHRMTAIAALMHSIARQKLLIGWFNLFWCSLDSAYNIVLGLSEPSILYQNINLR